MSSGTGKVAAENPGRPPRVGLFGLLCAGNIGNDASMEAVLGYLRTHHPEAIVDAMCPGPKLIKKIYGVDSTPMIWYQRYEKRASGSMAFALKAVGKGIDAVRTAAWVRRHDVVIIPGAGVLEATLPLKPWGMPYALFLVSASGRVFSTKVAMVCVGASPIKQRATRWLSTSAARLAFYRSLRDEGSREALRQRGVDISHDHVYPDLAFSLSAPDEASSIVDTGTVGVGVMEYLGSNDDRNRASAIYDAYVTAMVNFIQWLIDGGRNVRLLVGDTFGCDDVAVARILTELSAARPDIDQSRVITAPIESFSDLMAAVASVDSVVAIRFHNVLAGLKLCKPTISIGYSAKHDALMADMGLGEFIHSAKDIDVDRLIEQFTQLEKRSAELSEMLAERNQEKSALHEQHFRELSAALFPSAGSPGNQD